MENQPSFSLNKQESTYFKRYSWPIDELEGYTPAQDLEMVVVIPSYKETQLDRAIESLFNCSPIPCSIVVLIVINEWEDDPREVVEINKQSLKSIQRFKDQSEIEIKHIHVRLPQKKAGVGLARKIGMDQATRWFNQLEHNGIIVCYDADCTTSTNYLSEIYQQYKNKRTNCAIVFYEHPIDLENGIIEYELHLRYYVDALRYANFPYAFQTLGSCITVSSESYIRCGGMNTRKAGEDFYFLHRIMPYGDFYEINNTTTYPSSRISDRVPFGTGKALSKYDAGSEIKTYDWRSFETIKSFIDQSSDLLHYSSKKFEEPIQKFLKESNFTVALDHILKHSKDPDSFRRNFFNWFDGFRVLKFIHFLRDNYFPDTNLFENLKGLNQHLLNIPNFGSNKQEMLVQIREWDRKWSGITSTR